MNTDLEQLYNEQILALAASISRHGALDAPDGTARVTSPVCGSRIEVSVRLSSDGGLADYGQRVHACAIGQASAAIMARHAVGADRATLEAAKAELEAILAGDGPEQTIWRELEVMRPVRDFRARHAAALLPFRAVLQAYDQAAAKMKAG
jgi:NifU-like protein involved in Fe-S cluster formation